MANLKRKVKPAQTAAAQHGSTLAKEPQNGQLVYIKGVDRARGWLGWEGGGSSLRGKGEKDDAVVVVVAVGPGHSPLLFLILLQ